MLWMFVLILLSSFAVAISDTRIHYSLDDGEWLENQADVNNDGINFSCVSGSGGQINEGYYCTDDRVEIPIHNVNDTESYAFWWNSSSNNKMIAGRATAWNWNEIEWYMYYSPGNIIEVPFGNGADVACHTNFGTMEITNNEMQHFVLTINTNSVDLYWNGTKQGSSCSVVGRIKVNTPTLFGGLPVSSTPGIDGNIDDIYHFNKVLSQAEVTELYTTSAVPAYTYLNVSATTPTDNSQFNVINTNFTVYINSSFDFYCDLYFNETLNVSTLYSAGQDVEVKNSKDLQDASYTYHYNCYNETGFDDYNTNTTTNTFYVDTVYPNIIDTLTADQVYLMSSNITGQINFSDDQIIHSFNVTIDDTLIESQTGLTVSEYSYELNYDLSSFGIGEHVLHLTTADGHTAEKLGGDYKTSNGLFNDYIKYEFYDDGEVKIESKNPSVFDSWSTTKHYDKYKFEYVPSKASNVIELRVESDLPIYIHNYNNKYGGDWLVMGNHWLDFDIEDVDGERVKIKKVDDYTADVTITKVGSFDNNKAVKFNSIGDLNIITKNYTFSIFNVSESYDTGVYYQHSSYYYLSINNPAQVGDFYSPNININGTDYVAQFYNTAGNVTNYVYLYMVPNFPVGSTINHTWNYSSGATFYNTPEQEQTFYYVNVSICDATNTYPVLNFTIKDEESGVQLDASTAYNLNFYDGYKTINVIGSSVGVSSLHFCTEIANTTTYNFNTYGSVSSEYTDYNTRTYTYLESYPFTSSNQPTTYKTLYLNAQNATATVTYNIITTLYESVNGVMNIYKCDLNGTKEQVESLSIINGVAHANIIPNTQLYSYEIIYDGTLYTNDETYSQCHVEIVDSVSYVIDVTEDTALPIIGLSLADCNIFKNGTFATIDWGDNEHDETEIYGCIVGFRQDMTEDMVKVYDNCSLISPYSVGIPDSGFDYVVYGKLQQGNNTMYCPDVLSYNYYERAGQTVLGGNMLMYGVFLLLAAVGLWLIKDGFLLLIVTAVIIIIMWVIGLVYLSWVTVSLITAFLLLIAWIGRGFRK